MATFFEDLLRFKAKAQEVAKTLTKDGQTVDLNQKVLVGKQVYIVQVKVLSSSPCVQ